MVQMVHPEGASHKGTKPDCADRGTELNGSNKSVRDRVSNLCDSGSDCAAGGAIRAWTLPRNLRRQEHRRLREDQISDCTTPPAALNRFSLPAIERQFLETMDVSFSF